MSAGNPAAIVHLDRVAQNVRAIRDAAGRSRVMAVVNANGFGLGAASAV